MPSALSSKNKPAKVLTELATEATPPPAATGPTRRTVTVPLQVRAILALVRFTAVLEALHMGIGVREGLRVLRALRTKVQAYFGGGQLQKLARVDGRYFWTLEAPGWPGPALRAMLRTELRRLTPTATQDHTLRLAFLGITKTCPLACEHCYDWHHHNQPEALTVDDLIRVVHRFQAQDVAQIFLSGGEPLARYRDLLTLLEAARPGTDFWLLTSGYKLTRERAFALKAAGLTGVSVSLDHVDPAAHDRFRGREGAYAWALRAVRHAHEAGLVTALSLCATQAFTTEANLMAYARLAKQHGVAFIQVLEPRMAGRYADQPVTLPDAQIDLLTAFYDRLNFDPAYRDWPIVSYPGYHQRTVGCSGAGDRFLYVDAAGAVHACPFCQTAQGHILDDDWDEAMARLQQGGCTAFEGSRL